MSFLCKRRSIVVTYFQSKSKVFCSVAAKKTPVASFFEIGSVYHASDASREFEYHCNQ